MTNATSDTPAESLNERLAKLSPQQREALLRTLAKRSEAAVPKGPDPATMQRAQPGQELPLTAPQQQMWVFERLQPGTSTYHVYSHLRLTGPLNVEALRRAFAAVTARYDVLRIGFVERAGRPAQIVHAQVEFPFEEHDLRASPNATREAEADRLVQRLCARPFDLSRPPLMRAALLRLEDERHLLLLDAHHIITDVWSLGLINADLAECYNAYCRGAEPALAPRAVQYGDYVLWQHEMERVHAERRLQFWKDALAGVSGVLDLPVDRPRGAVIGIAGARHVGFLPQPLVAAVQEFARREGATQFMLFLTAFQALLARYCGDSDVVVGSPVANRPTVELEGVAGLFVNTIALRAHVGDDPSFRKLLAFNRGHALSALENAQVPMERVIDAVDFERAPGRTPLFQTMFVYQSSAGGDTLGMDGIASEWMNPEVDTARFEITLSISQNPTEVECLFDYASDLFEAATIARMARHFEALLAAAVAQPDLPLSQLPLVNAAERAELLTLGEGGAPLPSEAETLHGLIAAQTARTPDAAALVAPDATLSYADTLARAHGIADALRAQGVARGDIVAVLCDRSIDAVLAVLGVLFAGAAYLPLDAGSPEDRLHLLLGDSGARALIAPPAQDARATQLKPAVPLLRTAQIPAAAPTPPYAVADDGVRGDDAAYLIYTSGSTGAPKGVLIEHRGAVNLVQGFMARHDFRDQRLLMIPPLIFDASVGDLFPALACGSALVLHPNPTELGPSELERFCAEHGVTAIDAPAALWRRWSEGWAALPRQGALLPQLRLMMIGGESVPVEQVRRFAEITERRVALVNHYGPTETSVCATLLSTVDAAEISTAELPIGRPLPGVRTYVLDAHGALAPRGVVGELHIAGSGVARGYHNAEALSAERFVRDAFAAPGARMYRTGDLARWNADGSLQFIGRRDNQVKLRGFRIELGEIEAALANLAGVRGAAVLLREDRPGDKRLVAYVVADAERANVTALRAGLAQRLPEAMLPSAWVFLAEMPLTPNGKVDRRALPAPTADNAVERELIAPASDTEAAVLAVWRELLGREDLSTDDDFFNSGGDSLLTLPLVFKLHAALGVELPLSAVFATPTIAGLALSIDRARAGIAEDALDLHSKVTLPEDVSAAHAAPPRAPREAPASVLITGATGFLGAYVLRELLDITAAEAVCLVRADTAADGLRRIRRNLETYKLWREGDEARIHPVLGDLASPQMGLSDAVFAELAERVDAIVHNGGQVNFIAPYAHLEAANAGGTREVLKLAARGPLKPVQLVSTLGTYLTPKHSGKCVRENDPQPDAEGQHGGYNQSKWVGEQLGVLARSRGVPVAIHRPARITGDGTHGISNVGDYFNAWIRGVAMLGKAPHLPGDFFDMTPVDYVAKAIVRILLGAGDANSDYHYFNPHTLPVTEAVAELRDFGVPVEEVPYAQWRRALLAAIDAGQDNPLKPFAGLFVERPGEVGDAEGLAMPTFDCSYTESTVAPFGIHCLPADRPLFRRYLQFLSSCGALPAAATHEVSA